MKRIVSIAAALGLVACGDTASVPKTPSGDVPQLNPTGYDTAGAYLSCLEGKTTLVSAHRGGPMPGYPENAIETFEKTLSVIPALIETDVRETADGVLVLLHDETVDRTTNGSGDISDMTLAQAKSLSLKDASGKLTNFQIPTLDEALAAMRGKTILQLDVKRGVGLRKVIRAVEQARAESYAGIITYTDNGAIIVIESSDDVTVIAGADDQGDLAKFTRAGASDERMMIWTGIVRGDVDTGFVGILDDRDIAASGGALGYLDDRAESGDRGNYRRLASDGLDVIATDRPIDAARELGLEATAEAVAACRL